MTRSLYTGVTTAAASVTVYWAGTTTKPSIYVSATGTTKANPITADWLGAYSFWIDDGHYKIVNGSVAGDLTDVRISSTPEVGTSSDKVSVLPFLMGTLTTQQAVNEALLAGTLPQSGSLIQGPNGLQMNFGMVSEEITLNTGGTTTLGTADLIPANSLIWGGAARVTTTITTATDWTVSMDTGGATLVATNATMTAGTTGVAFPNDAPAGFAADRFKIVTTGTPGAGKIRCACFYLQIVPPTS